MGKVPYKWLVATAFVFGLFMEILDITVLNTALPTLGREFGVGNATLQWVVTGYLLSVAVFIPASGWIGDRFGTKRTFLFALALFTAASVGAGLAPDIHYLIAARVLQGVGGGLLTPVGTAMLFRAFPPDERARASAVLAVPTVIAPALGPVLGGFLTDQASWRWIFFLNLPIGLAGIAFTALFVREHREENAGRLDVPGFLLAGAGLAGVLYALNRGPEDGWTSATVLATGLGGAAGIAAFVAVELRTREPLIDLRLFRDRMFRTANLAMFTASGSLLGVLFLMPLFLQQVRGLDATQSGLVTGVQALGMISMVPISSRLYPKVGPRRLLLAGFTVIGLATASTALIDLDSSLWWIRLLLLVQGWGMALSFIPLQAATFSTISREDTGRASSLFNTNRQAAQAIGVAVLTTVLVSRTGTYLADLGPAAADPAQVAAAGLEAFHDAFLAAVVFAALGVVASLFVRDSDASASLHPADAEEAATGDRPRPEQQPTIAG